MLPEGCPPKIILLIGSSWFLRFESLDGDRVYDSTDNLCGQWDLFRALVFINLSYLF